jgi:trimeric autotransporter adhesin
MKKMIFITIVLCAVITIQATAQWAIYNEPNGSTNPGVSLSNSTGAQIQIGVASCSACYSGQAQNGDVVFRTQGGGNTLFSIPTWSSSDSRKIIFTREDASLMEILANGQVKIGNVPITNSSYKLFVGGGIATEQLKVALANSSDWADYVFDKSYKLPTLSYVEKFVNANKHLPNVPSAQELVKEGVDVVQMQAKLLEKIEELTLYVIQLNKKNKALEQEVKKIQTQNKP